MLSDDPKIASGDPKVASDDPKVASGDPKIASGDCRGLSKELPEGRADRRPNPPRARSEAQPV